MGQIPDLQRSRHLCHLFNDDRELIEVLVPFFQDGLARGERCLYIDDAPPAGDAFAALRRSGVSVLGTRDAYLRDGRFEPERMYELLCQMDESARRDGFRAVRVAGEAAWMLSSAPGTERFFEYESRVDELLSELGINALCLYDRRVIPARHLRDALRTHPHVFHGGAVCRNVHHEPVDEFLAPESTPHRIDRMLDAAEMTGSKILEPERSFQGQRLEAVSRLAGGVAHELNNIMTAVLGLCYLSSAALPSDSPARGDIEEINALALRAASLTDKLLAFAQRRTHRPKRMDLTAAVRAGLPGARRTVGTECTLSFKDDDSPLSIFADPGALEQILVHLAVNAREAMPSGGTIEVRTEAAKRSPDGGPPRDYALLSVTDTGKGMKPAEVALVFDPFFSTKEAAPGKGLGLSAVYGLARQNGGFVEIQSAPGRGTTVFLYLPLLPL